MTSVTRFSIALVSCLLLSAGLASAAQRLDQVAAKSSLRSAEFQKGCLGMPGSMPCIIPNDKR